MSFGSASQSPSHGTGRSPAAAGTRSQPGSTIVGPKWRYFPTAASKRTRTTSATLRVPNMAL